MSELASDVGRLESAALARKERLEKLRAAKFKKPVDEEPGDEGTSIPR